MDDNTLYSNEQVMYIISHSTILPFLLYMFNNKLTSSPHFLLPPLPFIVAHTHQIQDMLLMIDAAAGTKAGILESRISGYGIFGFVRFLQGCVLPAVLYNCYFMFLDNGHYSTFWCHTLLLTFL